ncbi:BRCA1-associated RING domain protein 1-like isoform X2 [Hibiscus syriacus]|uniref:BRCA1-associated RING domain protein 1-like isoform X2 n=1 Tax=Hibiscus syriacus TaxID=106335 RepID=UPI00192259E3|nr:BRCA1-associated RING domain protein 1-like isoform X2 [Hibiscus syriacus]
MSLSTKQSVNRAINPWVLHLHKMGLELRCPHCLDLFKRPLLMPCDHLFCDSCIARNEFGSECPICKVLCADRAEKDYAGCRYKASDLHGEYNGI